MSNLNKYPIYVISKGRVNNCLTANFLIKDGVEFILVVEPQEYQEYRDKYPDIKIEQLPFSNKGLGSYPARNWVWQNSIDNGYKKHWILDDNIRGVKRLYKGIRILSNSKWGFKFVEDLTDNYSNIAISGMNYEMFITDKTRQPIVINHHIYSNLLIDNSSSFRWRLRYNEDTDLNLQALKKGYCLLYTNIYSIQKMRTMTVRGGNTDELYKDNGRLKMARMLEAVHPDVVTVKWKFGRPQHVVDWHKFKQRLIPIKNPKKINLDEYGKLTAINAVKSRKLNKLLSGV